MDYGDEDLGYFDRTDHPQPHGDRFDRDDRPAPVRATATRLDRPEELPS